MNKYAPVILIVGLRLPPTSWTKPAMKKGPRFPEAIPFRRGKSPVRPAARPIPPEWISPAAFHALTAQGTEAHRLASAPGLWLERFGADLLLSYQDAHGRDAILAKMDACCAAYGFSPRRIFGRFLPTQAAERGAPELLRGDASLPLQAEAPKPASATASISAPDTRPGFSSTSGPTAPGSEPRNRAAF